MKEVARARKRYRKLRRRKDTWLSRALDWMVYQVAPRAGAARLAVRDQLEFARELADQQLEHLANIWQAGGNERTHAARWMVSRLSPDSALEQNLQVLRDRSRDLYKNDGVCTGAVDGCVANVWGTGIFPQARLTAEDTGLDDAAVEKINRQLEKLFRRWSKKVDKNGLESYAEVLKLAFRSKLIDGESFIVVSDRADPERPLSMVLEVVDADRVETRPQDFGNPLVRMGIERDADGVITHYHVRTTNPHDTQQNEVRWDRVPVYRVLHDFDRLFPSQSRGIPWFTPVMVRLKDLKDFAEAQLISEQVAACYSAFITPVGDPEDVADANLAAGGDPSRREEDLEPGRIQYLRPGETVEFGNPNRPGNTLAPYMQWQLRAVASGLNYPYELLVKDYRELSYSAGRMSLIDGRMVFQARQQTTIDKNCDPLWCHFVMRAVISGAVDIDPVAYADRPWAYEAVAQQCPGWPWIDPVKEVAASKDAIEEDLSTLTNELAAHGLDLEDVMRQRLREKLLKLDEWAALVKRAEELQISEDVLAALFMKKPPAKPIDTEEPDPKTKAVGAAA